MNNPSITAQPTSPIPPDDLQRNLTVSRPNVAIASSICISHPVVDLLRTVTISRSHSPFLRARLRRPSGERNQSSELAKPSTSRQMRRINFRMPLSNLCGCCASALRLGKKSFSWRSVFQSQAGRRHTPNSMRQPKQRSKRNPKLSPQNIGRKC
jgi:hypothetical protein